MKESERQNFGQVVVDSLALYNRTVTANQLELWFNALRHYELEDFRRAMSAHVRDPDRGQYPPKPADIVHLLEGDSESAGLLAWSKVLRALEYPGTWDTVVFDDPAIHACISQMGGWLHLGEKVTEDEEPFYRQQFAKLYRRLRKQPGDFPPKLMGRTEAQNRQLGFDEIPDPVLVGDSEAAKAVYAGGSGSGRPRLSRVGEGDLKQLGKQEAGE